MCASNHLSWGLLLLIVNLIIISTAQDDNSIEDDDVDSDDEKRELLRWFPADIEDDCKEQPGAEQVKCKSRVLVRKLTIGVQRLLLKVREGKPSKACREDEERFCFCGRIGDPTEESNSWKFLCGTCKISFKLDRKRIDPSKDNRLKAKNVKPKRIL